MRYYIFFFLSPKPNEHTTTTTTNQSQSQEKNTTKNNDITIRCHSFEIFSLLKVIVKVSRKKRCSILEDFCEN
jgi:hypothetical protein